MSSKKNSVVMLLRPCIQKLQRRLSRLASRKHNANDQVELDEKLEAAAPAAAAATMVPSNVKEGHFAVHAVKGGETKRFVVELGFLRDPAFLMLLEQAKDEYGFKRKGALAVPCRPEELQRILEERMEKSESAGINLWAAYNITVRRVGRRRMN